MEVLEQCRRTWTVVVVVCGVQIIFTVLHDGRAGCCKGRADWDYPVVNLEGLHICTDDWRMACKSPVLWLASH